MSSGNRKLDTAEDAAPAAAARNFDQDVFSGMSTDLDGSPPLGLRARGKLERRRRIGRAAREVFMEKGYDRATVREIAARAEVAIGTVFLYATDKRELLLALVNDDLDRLTGEGARDVCPDLPFIDQVMKFLEPRYRFWASAPELARAAMREMMASYTPGSPGIERTRGLERRARAVATLAGLVTAALDRGEMIGSVNPEIAAWIVQDLYLSEVRLWLNEDQPDVGHGLRRLRSLLEVAILGLAVRS